MNVLFRVDASYQIGSGHVMRCLTLASELRKKGNHVIFLSRNLKGNLSEIIENKGYEVIILENPYEENIDSLFHSHWLGVKWATDAKQTLDVLKQLNVCVDWLVIDHYAIDEKWEKVVQNYVRRILVIDDLADRQHSCDVLVDQNYYLDLEKRYKGLVSESTIKLLGPQFAIIRDEFLVERALITERKRENNILLFFGGTDPTSETLKMVNYLKSAETVINGKIHVVVGKNNNQKEMIRSFCNNNGNFVFHYEIDYMARLMRECCFAIVAGGTITWERYCMGLPALVIAVAHNQIEIAKNIATLNIDMFLGSSDEYSNDALLRHLKEICQNPKQLVVNSHNALNLVDGLGKYRILEIIARLDF
ncbi:UDP-2,4-diacetamido-2,4,6-trideoxy-beta-L-altropyranose hydrolase [Bacillus sp. 7504-2]|nr:UDP-2,4-diacetamido-2,4,6-trideoxy-beta-L-altropyranose hydrolase [Bacillus sp. 7504-2]